MTEYYFDLETYSTTDKPDPQIDQVITIQYQPLATETGEPKGDLQILTEWDLGSERELLKKFKDIFLSGSDFNFIPIGVNLYGYDFIVLSNKFKKYFDMDLGFKLFRDKPTIDLKSTLVMINNGQFRGYNDLLGKKHSGNVVREWYEKNEHDKILEYIRDEAKNFVEKYQILKEKLPNIKFS